jgi:hypothetical protein
MAIPPELKFDVRVRERFIEGGLLKSAEVKQHLDGLPDIGDQAVDVTAKQPALQTEGDRDVVIVRTSAASRAPVAPLRREDDFDSVIDDDDDDDDDLDAKPAKAAIKTPKVEAMPEEDAEEKPKAVVAEVPAEVPAEKKDTDSDWGEDT